MCALIPPAAPVNVPGDLPAVVIVAVLSGAFPVPVPLALAAAMAAAVLLAIGYGALARSARAVGPLPTGEDEAVEVDVDGDVVLRVLTAPVPELLFVVLLPLPRIGKLGRPSSG